MAEASEIPAGQAYLSRLLKYGRYVLHIRPMTGESTNKRRRLGNVVELQQRLYSKIATIWILAKL